MLKSPLPLPDEKPWQKRPGRTEEHDWYRILVVTTRRFSESDPNPSATMILVVSENSFDGVAETGIYVETLVKMGVPPQNIKVIPEGHETITQMRAALASCENLLDDILFITSGIHGYRVLQHAQGMAKKFEVEIVGGNARPIEMLTDAILWVALPVIGRLGLLPHYLEWTNQRRAAGVL